MKITTISFQRTIPTGPYENVKIGLEATIIPEESPENSFQELVKMVDNLFISMNLTDMRGAQERIIEVGEGKLTPDQTLIQQINTCTDLKVLQSYRLIVRHKKELQEAYDNRLNEITNV